jgi:coenzyme F420-0:L-glutamate ligase
MRLYAVKTRIIKLGDNLVDVTLESLETQGLQLEDNDILAVTSKVVSYAEGRLVKLSEIEPSGKARELARRYRLEPELAELILREADKVYGGAEKAVLTLKDSFLAPNAGIDNKNAPDDFVVLWPIDARKSAEKIREEIKTRTGRRIAVLIIDSGLVPLRIGTIGLALSVAGFKPIKDDRSEKDLYGKPIVITRQAVADDLASAAHLLMGETTNQVPIVLIRDAAVDFDEGVYGGSNMMMSASECLYMSALRCSNDRE